MQNNDIEYFNDLPVKATIRIVRPSKYGTVPGLDEEPAGPEELERMAAFLLFEPLLTLGSGDRRWQAPATLWLHGLDA